MQELTLLPTLSQQLATLYAEMEAAYGAVAAELGFSCANCPDNCCDSYFLHYTYMEWAYLWEGFRALSQEQRTAILARATDYVCRSESSLALDQRPATMCPLNDAGRCVLYTHRLMICRLHGVPTTMTRPDGRVMNFPGCFRCQEMTANKKDGPVLQRTAFFRRMVALETSLLQGKQGLPRVKMTLARLLVQGPPPNPPLNLRLNR